MCGVSCCQLPEIQSKRFLDALPDYIPITGAGRGEEVELGDAREVITSNRSTQLMAVFISVLRQPIVDGDLNSLHFTHLHSYTLPRDCCSTTSMHPL